MQIVSAKIIGKKIIENIWKKISILFLPDSIRSDDHPFEHTAGDRRVRLSETDTVHRHFPEYNNVDVVFGLLLQCLHENE